MLKMFQAFARVGAVALTLAAAGGQNAARAGETKSIYFGRWTVDDPTDKFSPNGKLYRVIDIAPCGADFCGVSVDVGACGATLFRFLAIHEGATELNGHGKWGADKKKLWVTKGVEGAALTVQLGNEDFHPGSRMSAPTFDANYHKIGEPECKAGAAGA